MAIYQFYLATLPKEETIEYFDGLPSRISSELQKGISSSLDEKFEDEFVYRELIQHKCWSKANFDPRPIIDGLDKKLKPAQWGNSETSFKWKNENEREDNDAWISLNEQKKIEEFAFRCDLRQPEIKFLREMILLAHDFDLLFVDIKGNIATPEFDFVIDLVRDSNAYRYIINPKKLIDDIQNGKIEKEGKR